MLGDINFVRQYKQRCGSNTSIIQQLVQFFLCGDKFVGCRSIYDVEDNIASLCIPTPFCSILFLSTYLVRKRRKLVLNLEIHVNDACCLLFLRVMSSRLSCSYVLPFLSHLFYRVQGFFSKTSNQARKQSRMNGTYLCPNISCSLFLF